MPEIASETCEAFEIIGGPDSAGVLLIADHAQATIPAEFSDLGLPKAQLARHIAYDIGTQALTRALASRLNCPAVISGFSRLLIDPNRGIDDPTLVMRIADGAVVPGNARLDDAGKALRIERFYKPYDNAINRTLRAMDASALPPLLLSLHSFTPEMKGVHRPWHVTVIWDFDPRLNRAVIDALKCEPGLIVGENEPYQGGYPGDTLDRHVLSKGIAHALIELRQNEIDTDAKVLAWADRLARLLKPLLNDNLMRERRVFGGHELKANL